jgi:ABC-type bacteriocin/lantibiotic exporter with double-glycine peptidase domain
MVVDAHGERIGVPELRARLRIGRDGTSARDLVRVARELGFRASGRRCVADEVRDLPLPAIAFVEDDHYVVVERAGRRGLWVVDPVLGREWQTDEEFAARFRGVVLTVEGDGGGRRSHPRPGLAPFLTEQLRGRGREVGRLVAVSAALSAFGLLAPAATGLVVDRLLPAGRPELLLVALGALAFAVAGRVVMGLVRSRLSVDLETGLDERLTRRFAEHVFRLPLSYFDVRSTGDLLSRVASGSVIRQVLTNQLLSAALDAVTAVVFVAVLAVIAPDIALAVLVVAAVMAGAVLLVLDRYGVAAQRAVQLAADGQSAMLEALTGVESVKFSALEPEVLRRWRATFDAELVATHRYQLLEHRFREVVAAVQTATVAGVVVYGALGVLEGRTTLGTLLTSAFLVSGLVVPLTSLAANTLSLRTVAIHFARMNDVLEHEPEPEPAEGPAPDLRGAVEVRDARFTYPGSTAPAVDGVSLAVPAGGFVAIVGGSGSGKSTLAKLLFGLLPLDEGHVLVDGHDVAELGRSVLAARCGAVAQDPAVFQGTIMENILLGAPGAGRDEAVLAARQAVLHEDVQRMRLGYDTRVGERGFGLSGGQRQRLALARAIVRRPAVLLLDEATSAVDARTEFEIFENLRASPATLVVIAHRLSTVKDADVIVVLEHGRVVEQGTHTELRRAGGRYADLIRTQDTGVSWDPVQR